MQDPVWADQAFVFPSWAGYQKLLDERADMAGRRWLDSIAAPYAKTKRVVSPSGADALRKQVQRLAAVSDL